MSEKLKLKPPVVVILGHVDHGKSSILEAIKDLKIISKESGGITQHIGAYQVEENKRQITFIDTPGHEAFGAMRSRGVEAADIAVLVIAADEGIKTQTKEAIDIVKKANIPFIVAINKIDKPNADIPMVKRQLAEKEIYLETMGGKVPFVEVSAISKKGIEHLLEVIILVAEMEDLKLETSCPAQGIVIESYLDHNKGPIATLIIKKGILKKGDFLATDSAIGKVKNMEDFQGDFLEKAYPSTPVSVLGFEQVPLVGELFNVYENQQQIQEKEKKEINIKENALLLIIKTDVLGSLEAIIHMIERIPQKNASVHILKAEPGQIDESDVRAAIRTRAKILCFKTKPNKIAKDLAQRQGVKILNFDVIYELIQAVENVLRRMIEPEIVRSTTGKIKVLEIFKAEKTRQIIGGKAIQGFIKRGAKIDIFRQEEKIGTGKINTLQQNKKETDSVSKGSECGILFETAIPLERGDILESYIEEKIKKEL
ncbi:MAG: translation initiation factor IF-2 [Candidatus Pacebacteria bacterium]|nr:translation initiation factor IF-2 [Candidatus Paceibacterota bacterium]